MLADALRRLRVVRLDGLVERAPGLQAAHRVAPEVRRAGVVAEDFLRHRARPSGDPRRASREPRRRIDANTLHTCTRSVLRADTVRVARMRTPKPGQLCGASGTATADQALYGAPPIPERTRECYSALIFARRARAARVSKCNAAPRWLSVRNSTICRNSSSISGEAAIRRALERISSSVTFLLGVMASAEIGMPMLPPKGLP